MRFEWRYFPAVAIRLGQLQTPFPNEIVAELSGLLDEGAAHEISGDVAAATRLSNWSLLARVGRVAATTSFYPSPPHIRWLRRAKLYLSCAARWRALRAWHERHANPHDAQILVRHPLFPVLIKRPYINSTWPIGKTQAVIEGHYQFVRRCAPMLAFAPDGARRIASLDSDLPGLHIVLDKSPWFQNEGEVVLNLFLQDERVYSLAFSLGFEGGEPVGLIGALQGSGHGPDALQRHRVITRRAFGMRSRDLIFSAFAILCAELGIQKILAPGKAHSVVKSEYFGGGTRTLHADYDSIWAQYGARPTGDGTMFEMPASLRFRSPSEIPSKKKAMYRRRYEMLRTLQADLAKFVSNGGADTT
ncbi:DUF535 family protein [Corticibacterium sp. UT-5YL-CI-8]|nr:DUF535 family protein [Tianweitania sp. UT-5YL-CI-8]